MNAGSLLQELERLGSAQTRKTYIRHGVKEPLFGVKYGDLSKIVKRIKMDHALALALWESGNHDARVLAMKIADPAQVSAADVERWSAGLSNYVLTDAVSETAANANIPPHQIAAWCERDEEYLGRIGWQLLSYLACNDKTVPDTFFYPFLDTIKSDIHTRKNRVREAMNGTLIAIGTRSPALEKRAIEVARVVGNVIIDHGDTACKTPDAEEYIRKAAARKRPLSV